MRSRVLLLVILASACGRPPEPEVAEQPTVEIPEAAEVKTPASGAETDAEEESQMPSSQRDRARPSKDDEESEPLDHDYEPPLPGMFPPGMGPTGGPDCEALADCCLKLLGAVGSVSADPRMCDGLRVAPAALCSQMLPQFSQAAAQQGVQCGP